MFEISLKLHLKKRLHREKKAGKMSFRFSFVCEILKETKSSDYCIVNLSENSKRE